MICADTNIFVSFFRGIKTPQTDHLQELLENKQLLMSPFVLSELLSSPKLPKKIETYLTALPRIELSPGFFERSGALRKAVYQKGRGVSMVDVYIAQACIDTRGPLLTEDEDLEVISEYSALKLVT